MFGPIEVLVVKATPEMIHNWGWFLAFGIVLLLLGIAAIVRSFAATVASMVFFVPIEPLSRGASERHPEQSIHICEGLIYS